jgi:hypothetical protein
MAFAAHTHLWLLHAEFKADGHCKRLARKQHSHAGSAADSVSASKP